MGRTGLQADRVYVDHGITGTLEAYALGAADGVRLLGMGAPLHTDEGCLCSAHTVVSALQEDLCGPERVVVVDMEASPEHLSRGTVRHVDLVCLVVERYYRSLETVRRRPHWSTSSRSDDSSSSPTRCAHRLTPRRSTSSAPVAASSWQGCCRAWRRWSLPTASRRPVLDWPAAAPYVEAVRVLPSSCR